MKIPLCRPYLSEALRREVLDVLDSGQLTEGGVTRRFEAMVAQTAGCRHGVAVTSCTVGLEIALRSLGLEPGDEIIVPDYTFPATAQAVLLAGATPVLVDIDPRTMLLDLEAAQEALTPRTRAVMPVSLFGNPLDYDALGRFAAEHDLLVVEDAACALGASHKGRPAGSAADLSVFSFHPRKPVTTGEGGVIVTNDDERSDWLRSYAHFGQDTAASVSRRRAGFVRLGTNAKLSNVHAALGVAQMRDFENIRRTRAARARRYLDLLRDAPGLVLPATTAHGEPAWQSFCVLVPRRDRVMEELLGRGIETQIGTYALHMHEHFRHTCVLPREPLHSREAFDACLALPLYHAMTDAEQDHVVGNLLQVVSGERG